MKELIFIALGLGESRFNNPIFDPQTGLIQSYADFMREGNVLIYLMLIALFGGILMSYIYYVAIDHVSFRKPWHWLIWNLIVFFLIFGVGYWIAQEYIYSEYSFFLEKNQSLLEGTDVNVSFLSENTSVGFRVGLYGVAISVLSSFLIRFKSINCRNTPF